MSNHAWCSNPARDEAVRAAEDAAAAERTTLPDHRDLPQAVAELRRRVEQLEACACAGLLQGLGDDPPNDFTKTARIRESETAVEPVIPAADAHGGGGGGLRAEQVTNRRPVDAGGGGNVTPGLRTERVTLEVTHDCKYPTAEWVLDIVQEACSDYGESVRVVEEAHFDDLANVALERDAAIRKLNKLRAERITQSLTADRFAEAVADADRLRACVAELISERDAAIRERDELRTECERLRVAQVKAAQERDKAHRARGRIRSEWENRGKALHNAYESIGKLRARVAELEGQLESVACRAATAENRVAELEAAQSFLKSPAESCKEEREAGNGGCGACAICCGELRTECERLRESVRVAARNRTFWHQQCALRETRAKELESRVAELEAAPAASGAANSPESPVSSEPVAYWVQWKTDTVIDSTFPTRQAAEEYINEYAEEDHQPEIVPIYTAPPPARGWLTKNERAAIESARDHFAAPEHDDDECVFVAAALRSLLARSSPPEVELPDYEFCIDTRTQSRDRQWIAALAAAGVAVKEVE